MICRLCLHSSEQYLEFFDENGLLLKLSSIVSKYFWFEPKKNDPISNIICNQCWISIESFHKFYTSIEIAQGNIKFFEVTEDNKESILKIEDNLQDDSDILFMNNANNKLYNDLDLESSHILDQELDPLLNLHKQDTTDDQINEKNCPKPKRKKLKDDIDLLFMNNSNNKIYNDVDLESSHILDQEQDPLLNLQKPETINDQINKKKCTKPGRKKCVRSKKTENIKFDKCEKINKSKLNNLTEAENDEKILSFIKLKCDECQEEFPKYMLLKRHVRAKHNRSGYVICCDKKFYRRFCLLNHINLHLNPDYFRCLECNKTFGTKRSFDDHNLTRHQTNETKLYKCDLCPRKYIRKYLLDKHYKLSHTNIEKMWKCDICDKGFATKCRMMTHLNYKHKNTYAKICDICAKVCRDKTRFDKHMLEHKGIAEPKVQCEQCEAWLNPLSLYTHMRRHKEENLLHKCSICGKSAGSKFSLKNHVLYVHTEARHKCTVCDKSFKRPITLKEHMATHTGEILYTCPLCPKTFNSNANMWSHKKKAHREQWETDRKNRKAPQKI